MTKQEYVDSLSIEDLRTLVMELSEFTENAELARYMAGDPEQEWDEDYNPAPCFFCLNTGRNLLDNEED